MKSVWMTAPPVAKVRPGVVLFVYGAWGPPNTAGPPELRRQFIAVDRGGLRPAASEAEAVQLVLGTRRVGDGTALRDGNGRRARKQLLVEL
jgi:hypothetical protein